MIKGMVCDRCKTVIHDELTKLGYSVDKISLGKITLSFELLEEESSRLNMLLKELGFELISSKEARVTNKVKEIVAEVFSGNSQTVFTQRFSSLFSEALNMNYDSISEIFTSFEGTTIEKYIISKRLEKVKELLVYTDLTMTEIAYIVGFNSINHLSRQFKELTGLPPSHFRTIRTTKAGLTSGKHDS